MQSVVERFLLEHSQTRDLRPAYSVIERWVQDGETSLLVELLAGIERQGQTPGLSLWPLEAIADRIERMLALTPGAAQVEAALAGAKILRPASIYLPHNELRRQQQLASYLAAAQPPELLYPLFARPEVQTETPELLAALLHELVVWGYPCAEVPVAQQWSAQLAARQHPLAWLPLHLSDAEQAFTRYLPRYSIQGASGPLGYAPTPVTTGLTTTAPAARAATTRIVEVTRPEEQALLASAVTYWRASSNGTIEARVFALDPPLTPQQLSPTLLGRLGLACLTGITPETMPLVPIRATDALTALFIAAVGGGAFARSLGGAYSRRYAWRSLGALAGLAPDGELATLLAASDTCSWWSLEPAGTWFEQAGWDLGLVILRATGDSLAVLAATDTDL